MTDITQANPIGTTKITTHVAKKLWPINHLKVESLDIEAQGVAHTAEGKVVFIDGALPFEVVTANTYRKKDNWEKATLLQVIKPSNQRVSGKCPHFGMHEGACGGCKMQHLHPVAQVAVKQRALEDGLAHLGKVKAANIMRPIEGPSWGYRYRARLSVRFVRKKGEVLVGFHERKSRYVADMKVCHVLPKKVSDLLLPLRVLIGSMDAKETIPQIELACGDNVVAMVLRHMEALSSTDCQRLQDFVQRYPFVQWWLQPKGLDTVHLMPTTAPPLAHSSFADAEEKHTNQKATLSYTLPQFGVTMPFKPTDFTQVNPHINQVLVSRALRLLDVQPSERVIDWFCGLGNFTLPLATQAGQVLGIEGSEELVLRSRQNETLNRQNNPLLCQTEFKMRNLFDMTADVLQLDGVAEKWLMDPPREGAFALVQALAAAVMAPEMLDWQAPKRIVYVSCNPATLARDAGVLVHEAGYVCTHAGVVNMFPHTAHVESIAVFEKK